MIQKIKQSSLATLFFLSTSIGFADGFQNLNQTAPLPLAVPEKKCDPLFDSRAQLGADYTYLHFVPVGSDSFNGSLWGEQGLYEYRPLNNFYAAAKFSWKQGNTTAGADERFMLYFDTQERLGYTVAFIRETLELSLYTGMGYHYFGQNLTVPTVDPLYFAYNQFYVPVGFALNYVISPNFSWGFNGTWMPQVFTTVAIDPLPGAYWTLTRTFGNFRVESPFDFAVTPSRRCRVLISPFFEFWQDGESFAITTTGIPLGLPGNTYYSAGVDVNFGFTF